MPVFSYIIKGQTNGAQRTALKHHTPSWLVINKITNIHI